jgi:ribosomal protein L37E
VVEVVGSWSRGGGGVWLVFSAACGDLQQSPGVSGGIPEMFDEQQTEQRESSVNSACRRCGHGAIDVEAGECKTCGAAVEEDSSRRREAGY